MPFKERTAQWWHEVADHKCQYEIYDEHRGFHDCGKPSRHIHHIIPEGTDLTNGVDSEHAVGMALCEQHHVRNLGDEEFSDNFSFHPDAGQAYKDYRQWKLQNAHMMAITGKIDHKIPRQSPFRDMMDQHHIAQKCGERYHSGTDELDQYYVEKMRDKATRYIAETGDKKPDTAPHPRWDPAKKKHWYDAFFGDEKGEDVTPPQSPNPARHERG